MGNTFPPPENMCGTCKHYRGTKVIISDPTIEGFHVGYCKIFPDGIPDEISTEHFECQHKKEINHG